MFWSTCSPIFICFWPFLIHFWTYHMIYLWMAEELRLKLRHAKTAHVWRNIWSAENNWLLALTQTNTEVIVFPQGFNKLPLHLWFPREFSVRILRWIVYRAWHVAPGVTLTLCYYKNVLPSSSITHRPATNRRIPNKHEHLLPPRCPVFPPLPWPACATSISTWPAESWDMDAAKLQWLERPFPHLQGKRLTRRL